MGTHSTLNISREAALRAFHELYSSQPSNEVLERILNQVLDTALHNVSIVQDYDDWERADEFVIDYCREHSERE